jgi:hypothetical protein
MTPDEERRLEAILEDLQQIRRNQLEFISALKRITGADDDEEEDDDKDDEAEDSGEWSGFLSDHPELKGARIAWRHDAAFSINQDLDPVLDRAYVSWPYKEHTHGVDGCLGWWNRELSAAQVMDGLRRGNRTLGRPITVHELLVQIWGPDADLRHCSAVASWLIHNRSVQVDRSNKPNRYSLCPS